MGTLAAKYDELYDILKSLKLSPKRLETITSNNPIKQKYVNALTEPCFAFMSELYTLIDSDTTKLPELRVAGRTLIC